MKQVLSRLTLLLAVISMAACSNDDADHQPGLWTAQDIIQTFPGDTVLVAGQVSNYVGMDLVEIKCAAWGIDQKYTLAGKHAKVFNYNYRMPVPESASFDQQLEVTVTDINGKTSSKAIQLTYLTDTSAPYAISDIPSQISVDYDMAAGEGTYNMNLTFGDDRQLKSLQVAVPAIGYNQTVELKGRSADVHQQIKFGEQGSYPMTLTLSDQEGNPTVIETTLVVMLQEDENPYEDYSMMWVVNASEKADDYLDGYYSPMARQDAYQYQGKFYADKDGYQLFIVPTKTMDGDIFGASPYVASKIMNNRDYVVPITIETKGYYGIWIDINAHTWSVWSLDTSAAYTGSLTVSGCGFNDFGDWGTPDSEMPRDGFRYTQTLSQNGAYSGARQYYAARVSDWGYILRYWSDATGCGWWEDTDGAGGSVGGYESDYNGNVEITFDTALLWATVKKTN